MTERELKNLLYEHVARIGKAVSSPKRLELLEALAQGEKTVDALARQAAIDIKLASAHLKVLREARLIVTRRDGKYIHYRLAGNDVSELWVMLRNVAEEHLVELRVALDRILSEPERLSPEDRLSLLDKARSGEVVVIDVRPEAEFRHGHLPFARSLPLAELERRLVELPAGREIVAYCRGPFCLMSGDAVKLLQERGFRARKIADGVAEWAAGGLAVEVSPSAGG